MDSRIESRRRNAHKRRSGIYEDNPQPVQRRTSKKSASKDRQGHVFAEDSRENVIPGGTPEPPSRNDTKTPMSDSGFLSSPGSTSPQLDAVRKHHPFRNRQPQYSLNGYSLPPSSPPAQSRPRTRTLEDRIQNKSPALEPKFRQRVGSLHSPPYQELQKLDTNTSSIGFPSISPPLEPPPEERRRLAKPRSRPMSPVRMPNGANQNATKTPSSIDAQRIMQLMKTTCGRMHGVLTFRVSGSSTWSSGYCAINVASGNLIYQAKGEVAHARTLIPDLRGCQVQTLYDSETNSTYLNVSTAAKAQGVQLIPKVPETFDSWLAALLCWQPIRPKESQHKAIRMQSSHSVEKRKPLEDRRRNSEILHAKDAAIIKVGKMLMWDRQTPSGKSSPLGNKRFSTYKQQRSMSTSWRKVSCTLQENGCFKLFTETDVTLITMIPLAQLSRCAIQRLHPSILEDEFSLAIYPRYTSSNASIPSLNTVYLSMESRVLYEVWFVLLRAFTVPELYDVGRSKPSSGLVQNGKTKHGAQGTTSKSLRVDGTLAIRIIEAKMHTGQPQGSKSYSRKNRIQTEPVGANYFAEVHLDGEARARTVVKSDTANPFWREDFDFADLPPVLSNLSIHIKTRNPGQRDWTLISPEPLNLEDGDANPLAIVGDIEVSTLNLLYGKVDIKLDELERAVDSEKWWPVFNERNELVGDLLMKVRFEELVVLLGQDYQGVSRLLYSFSNGLTNQMAQMAHTELRRVADILLNIFQVSAQAGNWIMSLVEEEIDNVHKETPMSKFRYGHRIASNDSDSVYDREVVLRDLGKSATVEANLLFRGNTLLTKALDSHMRRLGKEYLEETLSERIRDIDESDPDCEVDPNRVQNSEDLQRNWGNLIALAESIWEAIAASAYRCPPELRMIFRHIRSCAEDRYGDFLRTVAYSSVSGFIFLRFFCPAVLNPKLFSLLKGELIGSVSTYYD